MERPDGWTKCTDAQPKDEGIYLLEMADEIVTAAHWAEVTGMGMVWIHEDGLFVEEPAYWHPIPPREGRPL